MKDLNYQLKQLCRRNREGSYTTQRDREHTLAHIADQLHGLRYQHLSVNSLKAKHVDALVKLWTASGLGAGTMKNRMAVLNGRMPVSEDLPYQWYDSPNVRFFTLLDFEALCEQMGLIIRERHVLDEAGNIVQAKDNREINFLGSLAVYRLTQKH